MNLYEGSTDIAALSEIYIDGEYEWEEIVDPKIIFDIGAHTGNTSVYFHIKYPNAQIYAIEASPKSYRFLCDNVKGIPQIKSIFCAVYDRDEDITFHESTSSLGSSIVERSGLSTAVTVPALKLRSLFQKLHVERADFVKIDIEGGEENLFKTDKPNWFSSHYIIEVHNDLMKETTNFDKEFFSDYRVKTRQIAKQRHILYAYK